MSRESQRQAKLATGLAQAAANDMTMNNQGSGMTGVVDGVTYEWEPYGRYGDEYPLLYPE